MADAGVGALYWFPEEAGGDERALAGVLRSSRVSRTRVHVPATPREMAAWNAAARVCLGELGSALTEWERAEDRIRRWRRRLGSRRWGEAARGRAEAAFLDRVAPAADAYRPVREAVE
ncbi:hypothetical protein PL81_06715, partial [Streptomyces sp. RSD-27]